jgi:NAD(P)-dependent dehydrogenase (short-subunit alcohol dehydrogenase family)
MAGRMHGRRVLMTGASRGIGFEASKLLLSEGAEVLGVARGAERLEAARRQLEPLGAFTCVAADLAERSATAAVAEAVRARWGALDALVNNAGIQHYNQGVLDEDPEILELEVRVNLLAPHHLIRALIPLLEKGREPRIVNVSSGAAQRAVVEADPTMPAYRISKYALNALTILYAQGLSGKVAVNSLDPGWLKTDLGGPNAPGEPVDGAVRILELLEKPFAETGKFWYGAQQIDF